MEQFPGGDQRGAGGHFPRGDAIDQHADQGVAEPMPAPGPRRPRVDALITDLDHTIFDWTCGFAEAIRRMLRVLTDAGCDREAATHAIRDTFIRHRAMECPSLLDELAAGLRPAPSWSVLRRAAAAYRDGWATACGSLPGVTNALRNIRRRGCRVIGYTESPGAASTARLKMAGVLDAFHLVICTASAEPGCDARLSLEPVDAHAQDRVVSTPWWRKGDAHSLREIARDQHLDPERLCCIGDHLTKDVAPALEIGAGCAWAWYGTRRNPSDQAIVETLRHWPAELGIQAGAPPRGVAVLSRFDELPRLFDFGLVRRVAHA
jgi:FMN phosphatase YigB (HAD superfamily)